MAMDSKANAGSTNGAPLDPEKTAVWLLEHPDHSLQGEPLLQRNPQRQGVRGAVSKFRHGVWLALLEVSFMIFGLYGILKQGGVYDSARQWLAHPNVIPEKPIHALGYSIKVKEPRSNVPAFSNNTCKQPFNW